MMSVNWWSVCGSRDCRCSIVSDCDYSCCRTCNVRGQGSRSRIRTDMECVCRRAGTGQDRDQPEYDHRRQERDVQVAWQAAVCTTSHGGRDKPRAGGDCSVTTWPRAGHGPMQASWVAGHTRRMHSPRSVSLSLSLYLSMPWAVPLSLVCGVFCTSYTQCIWLGSLWTLFAQPLYADDKQFLCTAKSTVLYLVTYLIWFE